jgi:hypothetical protein
MAKSKAPFPSISALQALIYLYARHKNLPARGDVPEKVYVDLLSSNLKKDQILKGSDSLIYKLMGTPLQSKPELTDSIQPQTLESIAQYVFQSYPVLKEKLNLEHKETIHYWSSFKDEAFKMPSHLTHLQERGYYKYLSESEKRTIDGYIQRRLNELGVVEDVITYSAYIWNDIDKYVRAPILQISLSQNFASYTIFARVKDKFESKAVLRTDLQGGFFKLNSNTMFISLVDENANNPIRVFLSFAIHDIAITSLKYLKGTISFSAFNLTVPTIAKVVLQKANTYEEARIITDSPSDNADPKILFDLINERYIIKEENLHNLDILNTHKIYSVLEHIQGSFTFGYLSITDHFQKKGALTIGHCKFEPGGFVTFIFPHHEQPMQAYISNKVFHGHTAITIEHFITSDHEKFKFRYDLTVDKKFEDRKTLAWKLKGYFSGFYTDVPAAGPIVFLRDSKQESQANRGNASVIRNGGPIEKDSVIDLICRELEIPVVNNAIVLLDERT